MRSDMQVVFVRMFVGWKHPSLQKAKVVRQLLLRVVHGQADSLLTSHRVPLDQRALDIDRSTRRLGWRGSSRGRLVLVGLEERHGCVFLRCGSTGLGEEGVLGLLGAGTLVGGESV
jgi:hypothetical protein